MILDVFNGDAFNTIALTTAINKLPFAPSRVGQMGLFQNQPMSHTTFVVEEKSGVLSIVPTTKRGGPATLAGGVKPKARPFQCVHLALEDAILADDLQGKRKFGTEDQVEAMAEVVNDRLTLHRQRIEITHEFQRVGALQGKVFDSDGTTVLLNMYDAFTITEKEIDFVLGTSTTNVKAKCLEVKRHIEEKLGGLVHSGVHCLAGSTWFDKFVFHAEVKAAYDRFQDGAFLRADNRRGFEFCGITFEEYNVSIGSVAYIPATAARFFPLGVTNLFKTHFAPADFVETVNTNGLPVYAKQERMEFDRGIKLHIQSNPMSICHMPEVLVKGVSSN